MFDSLFRKFHLKNYIITKIPLALNLALQYGFTSFYSMGHD